MNKQKKIIVVEDDQAVLDLLEVFFERAFPDYEIFTAKSLLAGKMKLEELVSQSSIADLAIVVIDGLDGDCFQIFDALAQAGSQCPVVLFSGSVGQLQERNGFERFAAVVSKPSPNSCLLNAVRANLSETKNQQGGKID